MGREPLRGKFSQQLELGMHRIKVVSQYPILLSANHTPVAAFPNGGGTYVLRKFEGEIQIDPTEPKAPYNVEVVTKPTVIGEQLDQEPPPQPNAPSTYLARLREKVRNSMGNLRESFADRATIYELVDDLDDFEEERQAKAEKAAKEAEDARKAAEKGDTQDDPPTGNDGTAPNQQGEGSKSQTAGESSKTGEKSGQKSE